MSEPITGSCLCGAVVYSVRNDFQRFYFCHCKQCQKISASAHVAHLFTQSDAIKWLSGTKFIKQFNYPNRDFTVVFCSECGSGLPFVSKSGKSLIVPAGSLDSEPNINVNGNIFWSERATWYDKALKAKHCDRFPE